MNGPVAIRYPRGGEGAWRGDTSSQPLACVRQTAGHEVTLVTLRHYDKRNACSSGKAGKPRRPHAGLQGKRTESGARAGDLRRRRMRFPVCASSWRTSVDNGGVGEWLASRPAAAERCASAPGNRFLPHGSVERSVPSLRSGRGRYCGTCDGTSKGDRSMS